MQAGSDLESMMFKRNETDNRKINNLIPKEIIRSSSNLIIMMAYVFILVQTDVCEKK